MSMSRRAIVFALGSVVLFGFTAQAQARSRPFLVRFVGTFLPFDQKAAGNLQTLTVSYKKHQWLFHVERVNVTGAKDSGTMFLRHIFPPRLSLAGSAQLLESLGSPESLGKRWTLEGLLYLPQRSFHVSSAKGEATTDLEQREDKG